MHRRIMEKLSGSGLDGYLIQSEGNRNYLCHKENYCLPGVMLVTEDEVFLATPSRNIHNFRAMYREYTVLPGGLDAILQVCKARGLKAVGYESDKVSKAVCDRLESLLGGSVPRPCPGFVEEVRAVKTPEELELLRQAVRLSDAAYLEFLNHLKAGMTEKEARAALDYAFLRQGADNVSFPTLLSSGSRGFFPHSAPTDKVIQKGDLVLMDFGVMYGGYCSDTSRTVVVGRADERQKQLYQTVLQAQTLALQQICAGMLCCEADALARNAVQAACPVGCFDYGLGHGVGVEGLTAHAKNPWKGKSANLYLLRALRKAGYEHPAVAFACDALDEKFRFEGFTDDDLSDFSGPVTVNLGTMALGEGGCELGLDLRLPVGCAKETVLGLLREKAAACGLEVEEYDWLRPLHVPLDSPLVQNLLAAYRTVTGDEDTQPYISAGATFARAFDNCVAFGANLPGSPTSEHQPNERVSIDNLLLAAEVYREALKACVT